MSDELIKSLNQRIAELEKDKAGLQVAVQQERKERKSLKTRLDDLVSQADEELNGHDSTLKALEAERDEWKTKATAAPSEEARRIAELETQLRTRDHRDLFAGAVGKELAQGVTVEDLWHFAGFDPAKAEAVDAAQITELVGKVRAAKPVLFVNPDAPGDGAPAQAGSLTPTPKPPLRVAAEAGRGARDQASGTVSISKSEMQEPGWMTKYPAKAKAFNDGTAVVVDG